LEGEDGLGGRVREGPDLRGSLEEDGEGLWQDGVEVDGIGEDGVVDSSDDLPGERLLALELVGEARIAVGDHGGRDRVGQQLVRDGGGGRPAVLREPLHDGSVEGVTRTSLVVGREGGEDALGALGDGLQVRLAAVEEDLDAVRGLAGRQAGEQPGEGRRAVDRDVAPGLAHGRWRLGAPRVGRPGTAAPVPAAT
jgi:hypothetical protein